jgi:hypothetical protein
MWMAAFAVQPNLASVLVDLLPLMIGAAMVPVPIIIQVLIAVSLIFGLFFLFIGITGLTG